MRVPFWPRCLTEAIPEDMLGVPAAWERCTRHRWHLGDCEYGDTL